MLINHKILGLDIEEHSILAAELRIDGRHREVRRAAEFVFRENVSFDKPAELGEHLQQFLKSNHFSAKNAVIGIPVKWLIMRQESIPPTNADSLASILRIKAEREFSLDYNDLVFDCIGRVSATEKSSLLLVATLRQKIKQLVETSHAAGLTVLSITSSFLAVASAFKQTGFDDGYGLYIRPDYAEFLVQQNKSVSLLRHIPVAVGAEQDAKASVSALGRELKRLISPEALQVFEQGISLQAEIVNGTAGLAVKKSVKSAESGIGRYAAAISVASAASRPKLLGIDFLNSHINPEKEAADGRRILRAVLVGLAVILCSLFLILSWYSEKAEVAELKTRLEGMKQDITEAEAVIDKVSFSRGWYSARPKFLDCLKQLTLVFPTQTDIWVTSLAIREDMQANVTGKSLDEKNVLQLLDALKSNVSFHDVEMLYMRNIGRSSKEISFAISFNFVDGR
jgi:hypothetical protein